MVDPFADLELYEVAPTPADIARAYAAAVRTLGHAAARASMDVLRDEDARAAAALLAPSMTDAAVKSRATAPPEPRMQKAVKVALRVLAVAVMDADARARGSVALPRPRRDPRRYRPVTDEDFK